MDDVNTIYSSKSGCICCPGAEQWFKVTLPRATQYTIFTTGSLDTVGALYDAAGNKLYEVDDYAGKLNFRITAILAGGVPYYISVCEAKQQTGNYQLKVTEKILVDSVSVTPSTIVLDMGKKYELPVSLNTRLNPSGVDWIDGLNVSISPANATETRVLWSISDSTIADVNVAWHNNVKYYKLTPKKAGTAKLYAYDYDSMGRRGECTIYAGGAPVTGITLDCSKKTISIGDSVCVIIHPKLDVVNTVYSPKTTKNTFQSYVQNIKTMK